MSDSTRAVTQERLRELFVYDEASGDLLNKVSRTRSPQGRVAGWTSKRGYRALSIDGSQYQAHRLVWLYLNGAWPQDAIDHINGDRRDNRIENLRDIPQALNVQNRHKPSSKNAVGLLGVNRSGNSFCATIRIDGKKTHLGSFPTKEAAHEAYLNAKRVHHKGCTI